MFDIDFKCVIIIVTTDAGQKVRVKIMNKKKALEIIENLKNHINDNIKEKETCGEHIYIQTWVIGTLDQITNKIKTGSQYLYSSERENTYEELYKELINYYFCHDCDPKLRVYCIYILFDIETRNMLVDLYYSLFTKQQRDQQQKYVRNYVGFTLNAGYDDKYYLYEFEYIRRIFLNNRG